MAAPTSSITARVITENGVAASGSYAWEVWTWGAYPPGSDVTTPGAGGRVARPGLIILP
jgi:hypothetical protein